MDRKEATALLKDLVEANIARPSYVSLKLNERGHFDLIIKGDCDLVELRKFILKKDLALLVDKDKGTCRIYKPYNID